MPCQFPIQSVAGEWRDGRRPARSRGPAGGFRANGRAGPAPGQPCGKGRRRSGNRLRAAGGAGFVVVSQAVGQGLRPGAGELHAAAVEPAGRGRAAEPGAGDSLQGILLARRQREVEGNPRPGGGWHVPGRCDGQVAGDLSAGLYGDGAGGRDGRVPGPGAGADRRLSGAREGTALEGDVGHALSDASCSCWPSAC